MGITSPVGLMTSLALRVGSDLTAHNSSSEYSKYSESVQLKVLWLVGGYERRRSHLSRSHALLSILGVGLQFTAQFWVVSSLVGRLRVPTGFVISTEQNETHRW